MAPQRRRRRVAFEKKGSHTSSSPAMPKVNGASKNASKSNKSKGSFARPSSSSSTTPSKRSIQISQSNTSTSSIPTTNIDNVVLGTLLFKTWYQSYTYPSAVLDPSPSNPNALRNAPYTEKIENLFVCNHCFKYSRILKEYAGHLKVCERNGNGYGGFDSMVPGRKIYTHGDTGWGIWEVDGDIDTMYCQNLSLFSKLFLDNKSVFFDVSGFRYYLLVHTSSSSQINTTQPSRPSRQVVGFFSKEKLSWDQNNLACILIFPPWQRKSLGTLLISISYEISRRENILGGPEKPISELGKRGYMRYWQAEIARFLLLCKEKSTSVEAISKGTWIYVEDVLAALREMAADVSGDGLVRPMKWNGKGERGRVRIDKEKVRIWAIEHDVDLNPCFYEDGFVEGYGYPKTGHPGVDEEEEDDED